MNTENNYHIISTYSNTKRPYRDEVDIKANKSKKTNQIGYNYYFHYLLFNMFTYQTKSAYGLKKIFVWLLLKMSPELRLVRTTYRSYSFQPYWIGKTVTKRLIKQVNSRTKSNVADMSPRSLHSSGLRLQKKGCVAKKKLCCKKNVVLQKKSCVAKKMLCCKKKVVT